MENSAKTIAQKINYFYKNAIFGDNQQNHLLKNSLIDIIYDPIFLINDDLKSEFQEMVDSCKLHHQKLILFKAAQTLFMKTELKKLMEQTKSLYFGLEIYMNEKMQKILKYTDDVDLLIVDNLFNKLTAEIHQFECYKKGKQIGYQSIEYANYPL